MRFETILWHAMFSKPVGIVGVTRQGVWRNIGIIFDDYKVRVRRVPPCFWPEMQRAADCTCTLLAAERKRSVLWTCIQVIIAAEFIFGARKPLFLGMRRFCFRSGSSWETVTFGLIYFIFDVIVFFFNFFLIPQTTRSTLAWKSSTSRSPLYGPIKYVKVSFIIVKNPSKHYCVKNIWT